MTCVVFRAGIKAKVSPTLEPIVDRETGQCLFVGPEHTMQITVEVLPDFTPCRAVALPEATPTVERSLHEHQLAGKPAASFYRDGKSQLRRRAVPQWRPRRLWGIAHGTAQPAHVRHPQGVTRARREGEPGDGGDGEEVAGLIWSVAVHPRQVPGAFSTLGSPKDPPSRHPIRLRVIESFGFMTAVEPAASRALRARPSSGSRGVTACLRRRTSQDQR